VVYLVGTGPGEAGLITVKGLECIRAADTIVYDRLVNTRLLSYKKPGCRLVFAGKEPGRHTLSQPGINNLLVEEALSGRLVARLKGGDPFVFGRGGEEAAALREAGVPFEIVPGITSAVAAPAYAGIPVTHRDYASSFTVVAGHEDPEKELSSLDWPRLASEPGTLVFLMGGRNLPAIVERLLGCGKDPLTPAAVIRWGTRPEQRVASGVLGDIAEKVKKSGLASPAVTVIGEVVRLRESLLWFENKPLFGRRVLVTRSREQAGELSGKIEELGGEALELPVISIVPPADFSALDAAIAGAAGYDWLVFTSVNGVRSFLARMAALQIDIRRLGRARLCAIGPTTARALEERGLVVDVVPPTYRAEAVLEALKDKLLPGQKVLLPRASLARTVLVDGLKQMGAVVEEVAAYETVLESPDAAIIELIKEKMRNKEIHAVTFTSPSTVRGLLALLGEETRDLLKGTAVACIGPVTAAAAAAAGLEVRITAAEYTIEGLVEALASYLAKGKNRIGGMKL
jgi:uroporphyrinogen III methyltransferase/synthase